MVCDASWAHHVTYLGCASLLSWGRSGVILCFHRRRVFTPCCVIGGCRHMGKGGPCRQRINYLSILSMPYPLAVHAVQIIVHHCGIGGDNRSFFFFWCSNILVLSHLQCFAVNSHTMVSKQDHTIACLSAQASDVHLAALVEPRDSVMGPG